jgi:hypothetical protein
MLPALRSGCSHLKDEQPSLVSTYRPGFFCYQAARMSRSLHTQKLELRAARRLARPDARRREAGLLLAGRVTAGPARERRLRIVAARPLPGLIHPLHAAQLRELLTPEQRYGLRLVRLRRDTGFSAAGLVFAEYVLPGEIHLYPVPAPPWRLAFLPADADRAAFLRHGATVTGDGLHVTVAWTAEALSAFYAGEVLAHELGHHRLQHGRAKRYFACCRRADHERRAALHARRLEPVAAE